MLPLADFLGVWAFLAVNVAAPGPNVVNTIASAIGGGRRAGMASALGVGLGVALWCLGMSLGMAALFALWPGVQVALTAAAVVLLCVFARRLLGAAWDGWRGQEQAVARDPRLAGVLASFLRSLGVIVLNPKALTSWLTVLAVFPVAQAGRADIVVLCLGAIALSVAIHAAYAALFSTEAALRFYRRRGWILSGAAGVFFASVAAGLAVALVQKL